jgi:hypothetical protein
MVNGVDHFSGINFHFAEGLQLHKLARANLCSFYDLMGGLI